MNRSVTADYSPMFPPGANLVGIDTNGIPCFRWLSDDGRLGAYDTVAWHAPVIITS